MPVPPHLRECEKVRGKVASRIDGAILGHAEGMHHARDAGTPFGCLIHSTVNTDSGQIWMCYAVRRGQISANVDGAAGYHEGTRSPLRMRVPQEELALRIESGEPVARSAAQTRERSTNIEQTVRRRERGDLAIGLRFERVYHDPIGPHSPEAIA